MSFFKKVKKVFDDIVCPPFTVSETRIDESLIFDTVIDSSKPNRLQVRLNKKDLSNLVFVSLIALKQVKEPKVAIYRDKWETKKYVFKEILKDLDIEVCTYRRVIISMEILIHSYNLKICVDDYEYLTMLCDIINENFLEKKGKKNV